MGKGTVKRTGAQADVKTLHVDKLHLVGWMTLDRGRGMNGIALAMHPLPSIAGTL